MGVRLVLVLELDGGTPAEVQAYGERVIAAIRGRQRAGAKSVIEWKPEQLVDVRLEPQPALLPEATAMTDDAAGIFREQFEGIRDQPPGKL